jgi:hypothetical protein
MTRVSGIAFRAFAVWVVLMAAESVHGVIRAIFLVPLVGDFRSRQIGVFTGSILILGIVFLCIRWIRAVTARALAAIGFFWLLLTLLFEFGAGHYFFGRSWESLFLDYKLSQVGLLPLGLAILTLSPLIVARVRGIHEGVRGK